MTYVYRYIDLQETQQKFTNIMKVLKYTFYALVLAGFASCGVSSDKNIKEATIEQSPITDEDVSDEGTENISLINTVYENSYLQQIPKVMKILKNTFQITHLKSCRRTMSLTAMKALAMPFMH